MELESLTDTDATLEQQVAVNSDNITRIFAEQERLRERLHTLEGDRATVLLLAQKVDNLARDLPVMVKQAAEEAAELVAVEAQRLRSASWQIRLGILAAIIAALGIIVQTGLKLYG